jgi:transposase
MVVLPRLHACGHGEHRSLPVYAILEGALQIVVANAQQVKKVPGRKTDVKDAEWIADLLCHGLLRSSFVPPQPIRALRDLTRYRRRLVESQSAERNRLLKSTGNRRHQVGQRGHRCLRSFWPADAASSDRRQGYTSGNVELGQKEVAQQDPPAGTRPGESDLAALEQRIQEKLEPYAAQLALLDEIPGVDCTLAAVIIAELGVDMSVFGSVSQLASWAGVCPGNHESAGKRKSSRIPKGNLYLKTALVEAANSAARAKGTYLRDKFYRLKARRGYKCAAVAIAHKILLSIYHMLSRNVSCNGLGALP